MASLTSCQSTDGSLGHPRDDKSETRTAEVTICIISERTARSPATVTAHLKSGRTGGKELVPHMIRRALSLNSVNTAGSSKIQSHPKSSLSGVTVVAAPRGASTLGLRS